MASDNSDDIEEIDEIEKVERTERSGGYHRNEPNGRNEELNCSGRSVTPGRSDKYDGDESDGDIDQI